MAMAENRMGLTPREWQIAELLLQGCENGEIAQLLKMKRRTVKAYMNRLFRRFEIKDGIKRVKLATLLYLRMCAQHNSAPGGHMGQPETEPSKSSFNDDPFVAAGEMAKWPAPPLKLQKSNVENVELNIQRTA